VLLAEAAASAGAAVRRSIPIVLRGSSTAAIPDSPVIAAGAPAERAANRIVPHTVVAHGPSSWHSAPAAIVIRTEQEWAGFWKHLPTRQAPPPIDFPRVTLLAIVLETGGGGAGLPSVSRVERDREAVVVHWQSSGADRQPDQSAAQPGPFVVVALTEPAGVVRFQRGGDR
jgi:hypothetical protein